MVASGDPRKTQRFEDTASETDIGRAVDEKLLYQRIRGSLRHKVMSSIRSNLHQQDFTFGTEERKSLFSLSNRYILPAPIIGLACLISIRWLRRSLTPRLSSLTQQTQPRLVPTQRSSKFPQSPFRQTRSGNGGETLPTGEASSPSTSFGWYNSFTWIIDALISYEAAKLIFYQYPTERMEALATIPLVSGKSVVSREFCPVLFDQFQGTPPGTAFDDAKLQAMFVMHEHCRLRKNYQRQLAFEFDGDITVPAPGVPSVGPHTAIDFDERFDDFVQTQQELKDDMKPTDGGTTYE